MYIWSGVNSGQPLGVGASTNNQVKLRGASVYIRSGVNPGRPLGVEASTNNQVSKVMGSVCVYKEWG